MDVTQNKIKMHRITQKNGNADQFSFFFFTVKKKRIKKTELLLTIVLYRQFITAMERIEEKIYSVG
jgi:hypothetical protein